MLWQEPTLGWGSVGGNSCLAHDTPSTVDLKCNQTFNQAFKLPMIGQKNIRRTPGGTKGIVEQQGGGGRGGGRGLPAWHNAEVPVAGSMVLLLLLPPTLPPPCFS